MTTQQLVLGVLVSFSVGLVVAGSLSGPIGWARALLVKACRCVTWSPQRAEKGTDPMSNMTWLQREMSAFLGCPACTAAWVGLTLFLCQKNGYVFLTEVLAWMFLPGGLYLTLIAYRSAGVNRSSGCGGRSKERPTSLTPDERATMENTESRLVGVKQRPWTSEGPLGS